jgi:hypothetical protein
MGVDVTHDVDPPDAAIGIDEEGDAPRELVEVLVVGALGAVRVAGDAVDVRQQAVGVGLVVGERLVLLGRVERDAEDLAAGIAERRGSITEPRSLDRSAGGSGLGIPPQQHPLPGTRHLGERDVRAVLVGQGEVGREIAFRQSSHGLTLVG